MKAALYRDFRQPLHIERVADPVPSRRGVVLEVRATGVCRSDWHGWMGHDPDIVPPHVPGHEMAGVVLETGAEIDKWRPGDRVTLPFVCGCGTCEQCRSGNQQVCDRQFQPGFTHWGSYAEYVAIDHADDNLVRIPDKMDFVVAAGLGCRFATAFRAVTAQGGVNAEHWVAVFGCGGVGLSAVMIAAALGAGVVAIDIDGENLKLAGAVGARRLINAQSHDGLVDLVRHETDGGAHVAIDAVGSAATCFDSVSCLRKRGRHVQVGLLTGGERHAAVPMDLVVARELEIVGSHGMQARGYDRMLAMIARGELRPDKLVGRTIGLEQALAAFTPEPCYDGPGVTVIDRF